MFLFKNEYQFYENAPVGRYRLEGQFDTATTLTPQLTMLENRSISKYRFNTLIFFGYKSKRDKISLTLFSNRLTTKTTQIQDGIYPAANPNYRYATSSLLYDIEGGLGPHLKGKHLIARQNHELTWDFLLGVGITTSITIVICQVPIQWTLWETKQVFLLILLLRHLLTIFVMLDIIILAVASI